jgi:hypothetical protein
VVRNARARLGALHREEHDVPHAHGSREVDEAVSVSSTFEMGGGRRRKSCVQPSIALAQVPRSSKSKRRCSPPRRSPPMAESPRARQAWSTARRRFHPLR